MSTPAQIKAIHTLKSRIGLSDEDYRDHLMSITGKKSSRDLSGGEALRFIDRLREFAGPDQRSNARKPSVTASGKYAPVLQALWITAWHLGLSRSKDDRALIAFVERQTGLKHTRFLVDHAAATRAIEGLKAWLARDGGVVWPTGVDPLERKAAICQAIAARLVAARGFKPFSPHAHPWPGDFTAYGRSFGLPAAFDYYTAQQWDDLCARLGGRLRAALAKQAAPVAAAAKNGEAA